MSMTGEQMHQVLQFANALVRMVQAVKSGEGLELSADETAAMVSTIRTLTAGIRSSAPPSPQDQP